MRSVRGLALAVLAVLAVLLTACSSGGTSAPPSAPAATSPSSDPRAAVCATWVQTRAAMGRMIQEEFPYPVKEIDTVIADATAVKAAVGPGVDPRVGTAADDVVALMKKLRARPDRLDIDPLVVVDHDANITFADTFCS